MSAKRVLSRHAVISLSYFGLVPSPDYGYEAEEGFWLLSEPLLQSPR